MEIIHSSFAYLLRPTITIILLLLKLTNSDRAPKYLINLLTSNFDWTESPSFINFNSSLPLTLRKPEVILKHTWGVPLGSILFCLP